jgi:hypothetical protein
MRANNDLPEVRARQPAFGVVTRQAGLSSLDAMRATFDIEIDEVRTAVTGGPVSPAFVASVLMRFPEREFRELF